MNIARSILIGACVLCGCMTGSPSSGEEVSHSSLSALTVSADTALDPIGVVGPAIQAAVPAYEAESVAAAFDGTNFLVAWIDDRAFGESLMASRVSPTGTVIDGTAIVVSAAPAERFGSGGARVHVVHSANGGYLVSWAGGNTVGWTGVRIKNDGTVVDKTPLSLGFFESPPVALTNGFASLSITSDGTSLYYEALFLSGADDATGSIRRVPNVYPYQGSKDAFDRIVFAGVGDRLVLFGGAVDNLGTVFPVKYAVAKDAQLETSAKDLNVASADYVTRYVVRAWYANNEIAVLKEGYLKNGASAAMVSRYSPTTFELLGEAVLSGSSYGFGEVTADDLGAMIFQGDQQNPTLCSYTSSYGLLGCMADTWRFNPGSSHETVALSPTNYLIPFKMRAPVGNSRQPAFQIFNRGSGAPVSGAAPTIIARSANSQRNLAIAGNKDDVFVAAWVDDTLANKPTGDGGEMTLRASRVLGTGDVSAAQSVVVSAPGAFEVPAVAAIGSASRFSVVSSERRGTATSIVLATLSATAPLTVTDSLRVATISTLESRSVGIVEDSTGRIVSWVTSSPNDSATVVYAKRIPNGASQNDVDVAPLLTLSNDNVRRRRSGLCTAFDGKQSVIVWAEEADQNSRLVGTTFPDGAVSPSVVASVFTLGQGHPRNPSLASNGSAGSLLTWEDAEGFFVFGTRGVYAKPLPQSQPIPVDSLNEVKVATVTRIDASPVAAYANDSASYVVAWGEAGEGTNSNIRAGFVSVNGRVLSAQDGEPISEGSFDDALPRLATGSVAKVGLLYNRYDRDPKYNTLRARFRTIHTGKLMGESCANAIDCASRSCVSGICCDDPCDQGCGVCGTGTCKPAPKLTVCGSTKRNTCSGESLACSEACTTDDECAAPSKCLEGRCTGITNTCSEKGEVVTVDGTLSCGFYGCDPTLGACRTSCESVEQCGAGFVCNDQKQCANPPDADNDAGCSATPRHAGSAFAWIAGLALGAFGVRRRRGRSATSPR